MKKRTQIYAANLALLLLLFGCRAATAPPGSKSSGIPQAEPVCIALQIESPPGEQAVPSGRRLPRAKAAALVPLEAATASEEAHAQSGTISAAPEATKEPSQNNPAPQPAAAPVETSAPAANAAEASSAVPVKVETPSLAEAPLEPPANDNPEEPAKAPQPAYPTKPVSEPTAPPTEAPTEPSPVPTTEPPTEAPAEIDLSAVVAYGLSYAQGLGYTVDSSLTLANASYYPGYRGNGYDTDFLKARAVGLCQAATDDLIACGDTVPGYRCNFYASCDPATGQCYLVFLYG